MISPARKARRWRTRGRSKLLIGAYCLQANAKTDAHIKAIHDCGVDFIIGGLPASDRATLDLFAKHGVGAIVDGVVPRWWAGVERSGKMRAANPPEKYAAGAEYTKANTWYPSWASDGDQYSPWTDGVVEWTDGNGKKKRLCSASGTRTATTGHAKIAVF